MTIALINLGILRHVMESMTRSATHCFRSNAHHAGLHYMLGRLPSGSQPSVAQIASEVGSARPRNARLLTICKGLIINSRVQPASHLHVDFARMETSASV